MIPHWKRGSHPTWTGRAQRRFRTWGRDVSRACWRFVYGAAIHAAVARSTASDCPAVPSGRTALLQPSLTANATDTWAVGRANPRYGGYKLVNGISSTFFFCSGTTCCACSCVEKRGKERWTWIHIYCTNLLLTAKMASFLIK